MLSTITIFGLLCSISTLATAVSPPLLEIATTIDWQPCAKELTELAELPILCAELVVPLDYTDKSNNATHTVELLKVKTLRSPSLGSIIYSWGGPGAEGLVNMATSAAFYMKQSGSQHDLISFNARGTSSKYLRFSCFDRESQRRRSQQDVLRNTFDASDIALGELWADGGVLADSCRKNAHEMGPYIGTVSTAKDVMRIVDALGEGPFLNYYGPSYGSVLGATLVAMFPDRMGAVVIDGVLNPHEFNKRLVNVEFGSAADAAFREFFKRCVQATPEVCALNRRGTTAADLEAEIWSFMEDIKHQPISLPADFHDFDAWFLGTKVDYSGLHNIITTTLYHPANFPLMASGLQGMLEGNFTDLATWRNFYNMILPATAQAEAHQGITCGDRIPRAVSANQLIPEIEKAAAVSRLVGQDWLNTLSTTACAQWPFEAKGRYLGDFKAKTANPVLVVGNTLDNVTPYVSARNLSAGFEGSILLERRAFGHTSAAQPSACTEKILADYYARKPISEHHIVCEADKDAFELANQ